MVVFWEFNHFVVLEGIEGRKIYINDPNEGPRWVSREEFEEAYSGMCFALLGNEEARIDLRCRIMFGTLQKRLPQELRLAGIATMAEANRFLEELFWPAHNARFARPAADTGSAFVAFAGTLEDILCAQEDRVVAGDNTVRYQEPHAADLRQHRLHPRRRASYRGRGEVRS